MYERTSNERKKERKKASYLRILYCLCLIILKFIWQHNVPVNEVYMFSLSHLKVVKHAERIISLLSSSK